MILGFNRVQPTSFFFRLSSYQVNSFDKDLKLTPGLAGFREVNWSIGTEGNLTPLTQLAGADAVFLRTLLLPQGMRPYSRNILRGH